MGAPSRAERFSCGPCKHRHQSEKGVFVDILRFQPVFRQYLWGGRRLQTALGKAIGEANDYAESWEIVDHADENSRVLDDAMEGLTLNQLMRDHGEAIVGRTAWQRISDPSIPASLRGRFPLLFKFLDANRTLSVQVHPDDARGATQEPPDLGKTEAWYVIEAAPGATIYAGLRPGTAPEKLREAVASGETEALLHQLQPRAGDCIFIPAGTVHAIGAGLLVAEIQQASNTTYRLFDWNRVDANGRSRELHVDQAIQVTDFQRGPVAPQVPQPTELADVTQLVDCDKFVLRRWGSDTANEGSLLPGTCRIVAVVRGNAVVRSAQRDVHLRLGETALIPATVEAPVTVSLPADAILLEMQVPN